VQKLFRYLYQNLKYERLICN